MKTSPTSAAKTGLPVWQASFALVVLIQAINARADIVAPYAPDEHTLHLWHMDAATAPVTDAAADGIELTALENGATLGNESFAGAKNFGTALGTYVGNPAQPPGCAGQNAGLSAQPLVNGRGDNVFVRYAGPEGAFTYEAIVRIDFDPTAHFGSDGWGKGRSLFMQLLSGDADENSDRVFQFRLAPKGTLSGNEQPLLEFINLNQGNGIQSLTAPIPTEGADAIRAGGWYHVAVTYDGQSDHPDNLRFYWTSVQPQRIAASLIGSGQMTHNLAAGCSPDFTIGQTGRQSPVTTTPNNNFVGLIDEVRISGVARSPQQLLFGGAALVSQPARVEPKPAVNPIPAIPAVAAQATSPATTPATVKPTLLDSVTFASGAVIRGPVDQPRFAILFSCRQPDEVSPAVLPALQAASAKASFFVSSDFLNQPAGRTLAQSLLAQGHYVGPQADTWTQLSQRPADPATSGVGTVPPDVAGHLKQLAALGVAPTDVRYFLPTSDQLTLPVAERARAMGLTMVAGTPGTLSFATATIEGTKEFASSQAIVDSILKVGNENKGLNGFLLLFPLEAGARRSDKFYARFGELLNTLQKRGYEFVRVDELLEGPAPGQAQPPLANVKRP